MGLYNKESGYGKHTQAVPFEGGGQVFVVARSAAAGRQVLQDLFKPFNGVNRYFATVDEAINATTASRGDVIYVAPNHTETFTAAAGFALDVAGVSVIGLGAGNNRPVFTISSTDNAGTITQSGNNTVIKNIVVVTNDDALTNAVVVSGDNCVTEFEHQDTSSAVEAATAVRGDTANNWKLKLKHNGFTGGNATVSVVRLDDCDNVDIQIDAYGVWTTAGVEMVDVASTNVRVNGYLYCSGVTNGSRDVVDTITASTWFAKIEDGAAGATYSGGSGAALASDDVSSVSAQLNVPSADVTTNTNERDVIGNKTDAAVTAVGTTKTIIAYSKGLVTMATVQSADSTNNAFAGDVVGNKTDASVYVPGTTKSLAAYSKGTADLQERVAKKTAATIVNGQTLFTVAGGPIQVLGLVSICETANDGTASTLQYSATPTVGVAQTISAASASLANQAAGGSVTLAGTALSTAALLNANGPNLIANPGTIMVPAGTITAVVGVGSTTGTWAHYLRYKPLAVGVTVS